MCRGSFDRLNGSFRKTKAALLPHRDTGTRRSRRPNTCSLGALQARAGGFQVRRSGRNEEAPAGAAQKEASWGQDAGGWRRQGGLPTPPHSASKRGRKEHRAPSTAPLLPLGCGGARGGTVGNAQDVTGAGLAKGPLQTANALNSVSIVYKASIVCKVGVSAPSPATIPAPPTQLPEALAELVTHTLPSVSSWTLSLALLNSFHPRYFTKPCFHYETGS